VVRTDPWTLNGLLDDPKQIDAALSDGRLALDGDDTGLRQLLSALDRPGDLVSDG
jgi:hypothetical protein